MRAMLILVFACWLAVCFGLNCVCHQVFDKINIALQVDK